MGPSSSPMTQMVRRRTACCVIARDVTMFENFLNHALDSSSCIYSPSSCPLQTLPHSMRLALAVRYHTQSLMCTATPSGRCDSQVAPCHSQTGSCTVELNCLLRPFLMTHRRHVRTKLGTRSTISDCLLKHCNTASDFRSWILGVTNRC